MKPDFEGTWNAQADEHNTWADLGEDEKLAWAYVAGLERAAEITKVGWITMEHRSIGDADCEAELCEQIAAAIRADKDKTND